MGAVRTVAAMSWIRRAWPLALLTISLSACPADGEDDTAAESGSNNDTSATAAATADASASADETATSSDTPPAELGCAAGVVGETTDGAADPLMQTWGAPCTTNDDCVALIGDPAAVCDTTAVVYELPGGYCTKPCTLPDLETQFVLDAPDCDPNGGVACIGSKGTFERCGLPCTDDTQCNRDGYICRQMPLIAMPQDPKMCLMPDCCLDGCAEE